jgi:hypothetical protein
MAMHGVVQPDLQPVQRFEHRLRKAGSENFEEGIISCRAVRRDVVLTEH